ncbi:MAG: right-handed parallel beta-helix repeat-containing protein [Polyangiaceae bacterium]
MKKIAFLANAIILVFPAIASAATYVVSPSGDDGNAGDDAHPWATLQHAADSVKAGDTVTVLAGDYQGFNLTTSGTAGAPITFHANAGVQIVQENDQTGMDGINIEDTENGTTIEYVVVEGFSISGMMRAGIRTAVSSHVTIRNNKTDQNGVWGIFTGFADDLLIEGNVCSRSGEQHGIYTSNSGDRPVIRNNLIWGNAGAGVHMNGDASQGGDGIISEALLEGNVIYDNGTAGGSGINCDGVQNSRFQNNVLYSAHASGMSLYVGDAAEAAKNNVVVNNTIIVASDGRWALNIQQDSTGNHVYNNILLNLHPSRGAVDIAPEALPGFVSDHNLVIDRFTTDGGDTILTLAEWQSATGQDMASQLAAPLFLDEKNNDYHLTAQSPAVDNGTSTEAPSTDADGVSRPQGAAFDIGAYEFCSLGDCQSAGGTGGTGTGGNSTGGASSGGNGTGGSGAGNTGGATGGGNGYCGPDLTTCGTDDNPGSCGCRTAGLPTEEGTSLAAITLAAIATVFARRRKT